MLLVCYLIGYLEMRSLIQNEYIEETTIMLVIIRGE